MIYPMRNEPTKEPGEDEKLWAARLFESKMRFVIINRRYTLAFNSTDAKIHDKLIMYFGGGVYRTKGTKSLKWRLTPEGSLVFLEKILPHLTVIGKGRVKAFVQLVDSYEEEKKRKMLTRDRAFFARAYARMGNDVKIPDGPIEKVQPEESA